MKKGNIVDKYQIILGDTLSGYYSDEVTCYERPPAIVLNFYKNRLGNLFLILCKAARVYCLDDNLSSDGVREYVTRFLYDYLGIQVCDDKKEVDIVNEVKCHIRDGEPVMVSGNLYALPYSSKYKTTNWQHLFVIKGYSDETRRFMILDNVHLEHIPYEEKDRKLFDFYLSEVDIINLYKSHNDVYGYDASFVFLKKNKYFSKYSERELLCIIINRISQKSGKKYRQIEKLEEIALLFDENADKEKIDFLVKKLLNINKYKNVMLNEIVNYMQRYNYAIDKINEILKIKERLYEAWCNFVTIVIIKIKRKKYQLNDAMLDNINLYEKQLVELLKEFENFLMTYEDDEKNISVYDNKENLDHIISISEENTQFEFDNGRTYNLWNYGDAPKRTLMSKNVDESFRICVDIIIDEKTKENAFQAGIFVRNDEGKVWFAAYDNRDMLVLDKIGIDNLSKKITQSASGKIRLVVEIVKDQIRARIENHQESELFTMFERSSLIEIGFLVKTWGNGEYLKVDFRNNVVDVIGGEYQ